MFLGIHRHLSRCLEKLFFLQIDCTTEDSHLLDMIWSHPACHKYGVVRNYQNPFLNMKSLYQNYYKFVCSHHPFFLYHRTRIHHLLRYMLLNTRHHLFQFQRIVSALRMCYMFACSHYPYSPLRHLYHLQL